MIKHEDDLKFTVKIGEVKEFEAINIPRQQTR